MTVVLDDLEQDAIAELLNMGMGRAAAALSEMVHQEIGLSVPQVELLDQDEALERLTSVTGDVIAGVRQAFDGAFWGNALLLFPESKSLNLVRAMLEEEAPLETLTDLEQEVLVESGNVILNACLGTLANVLEETIETGLPKYISGPADRVLARSAPPGEDKSLVLMVRIAFTVAARDISGHVGLTLESDSLETLIAKIHRRLLNA